MWDIRKELNTLISNLLAKRPSEQRDSAGRAVDWLPPVLGPEDWSIGMMAGRSANWYLERSRS